MSYKTAIYSVFIILPLTATSHADTLAESFAAGKADIDLRYRIENVEQASNPNDATAATLRTRLGFTTGSYYDVVAHMDFEHITEAGADDYNSTVNGKTTFPTIADPANEELNQAWLEYKGLDKTGIKLGRQRIILDNARFVGNVGWRQNEQTYDAITISNTSLEDIAITLSNIQQINSFTGIETDTNHNLLNISIDKTPAGKITVYGYSLDLDQSTSDTLTTGLRINGTAADFLYTVEYAQQTDTAENTTDFSAAYTFLEAGMKLDSSKLFLGYEVLGSDNGTLALQTPLATKHAFNGWADLFLTTPANGLVDTYLKAVTSFSGAELIVMYHDYSADYISSDYGTELNLQLVKPFDKNIKGIIKYADYSADTFSTDTTKIWLELDMAFAQ